MTHENTPVILPDHQAVLLAVESPHPSNSYSLYNHRNWPYKNLVSFRSLLRHVSFVYFLSPRECFNAEEIAIQQGIDQGIAFTEWESVRERERQKWVQKRSPRRKGKRLPLPGVVRPVLWRRLSLLQQKNELLSQNNFPHRHWECLDTSQVWHFRADVSGAWTIRKVDANICGFTVFLLPKYKRRSRKHGML